jgi:ubiquitin-like protein Pup
MSQQRISAADSSRDRGEAEPSGLASAPQASASGVDDLLDEIDSLLEDNAEAFVKSFVQKGGQ